MQKSPAVCSCAGDVMRFVIHLLREMPSVGKTPPPRPGGYRYPQVELKRSFLAVLLNQIDRARGSMKINFPRMCDLRETFHVISFSGACRALKEKMQIEVGKACRLAPHTVHLWIQAPNSSERHPAAKTYSKLRRNGFLGPEIHRFYRRDFMSAIMKSQ